MTGMFVQAVSAMLVIAAAHAPSEPPAAIRRPNLQVLTTVPESQLFPMMNAIADSLGVRCDHCHVRVSPDPTKTWSLAGGWVWDRDDKEPKRVAREMMRMVLDINTRQFGGRMVVTCYTCHRGHGRLEVVFKGADRVHLTSRMPPDAPASQTLNGESGWIASGSGSRALRPDEISRARRTALRYRPIKIDRPANWRIAGIERVGSRDAYVAVIEVDGRTKTMWFFDVASGLLLRERTTTETALVPLQEQVDYEDYRRVDGVMLPFRMRASDGAPFSTSVRVFTRIRHNVTVDDSTFEPPARPPRNAGGRLTPLSPR